MVPAIFLPFKVYSGNNKPRQEAGFICLAVIFSQKSLGHLNNTLQVTTAETKP
jgi:hypothetical protein